MKAKIQKFEQQFRGYMENFVDAYDKTRILQPIKRVVEQLKNGEERKSFLCRVNFRLGKKLIYWGLTTVPCSLFTGDSESPKAKIGFLLKE